MSSATAIIHTAMDSEAGPGIGELITLDVKVADIQIAGIRPYVAVALAVVIAVLGVAVEAVGGSFQPWYPGWWVVSFLCARSASLFSAGSKDDAFADGAKPYLHQRTSSVEGACVAATGAGGIHVLTMNASLYSAGA
ncbi:hypothetical protein ACIBG8_43050 [Nonomuraea sp. NPDC050556]|uniref:hypothetical protein n=1 Tax=Nonomuraea sp. NPDC050556 TaxID=3364369 RepID=UPI00378B3AEF